jgi:tripartite-type tricarboxylate transporter receptor subunit TctC
MPKLQRAIVSFVVASCVTCSSSAFAASPDTGFPSRPMRMVASEPGGSTDFTARLIAQGLADGVGQSVIVENKGGGLLAAQTVVNATPDGYTVLCSGSTLWTEPLLTHTPYDPVKDFAPVAMAVVAPSVIAVNPSVAAASIKELIALAKTKPGTLNYGSGQTGAPSHLAFELFKTMAGVNIVRVPYKGGGAAVTALIGGEVQISLLSSTAVAPHVKSGKLRALAVTTSAPTALVPGLPTVAASGLPGYESVQITGLFAPAKTPRATIERINGETLRVLNVPEVKSRLNAAGLDVVSSSPEKFDAVVKEDMTKMGKVIRDAGIAVR